MVVNGTPMEFYILKLSIQVKELFFFLLKRIWIYVYTYEYNVIYLAEEIYMSKFQENTFYIHEDNNLRRIITITSKGNVIRKLVIQKRMIIISYRIHFIWSIGKCYAHECIYIMRVWKTTTSSRRMVWSTRNRHFYRDSWI